MFVRVSGYQEVWVSSFLKNFWRWLGRRIYSAKLLVSTWLSRLPSKKVLTAAKCCDCELRLLFHPIQVADSAGRMRWVIWWLKASCYRSSSHLLFLRPLQTLMYELSLHWLRCSLMSPRKNVDVLKCEPRLLARCRRTETKIQTF